MLTASYSVPEGGARCKIYQFLHSVEFAHYGPLCVARLINNVSIRDMAPSPRSNGKA